MYKKILLAIDGSENSLRATDEAIKIAALSSDAEIEVLYVITPPKSAREILLDPTTEEKQTLRNEKIAPVEAKINAKNIQHKVTILNGEASYCITEHEKNNKYDLLVIGSRGLNAVQKFVLGSVSTKVVQKVHCPVLLIK